jgi:hypothetical protein
MHQRIVDHQPSFILELNAVRYKKPKELLQHLISVYKIICYLDFHSNLVRATDTELVSRRVGEDWLLFFDRILLSLEREAQRT